MQEYNSINSALGVCDVDWYYGHRFILVNESSIFWGRNSI